MAGVAREGRLSLWRAAFVVARRDFTTVLLSRAFIFFLLGPLFPVAVAALAGGIGAQIQSEVSVTEIGIAMPDRDLDAMMDARDGLAQRIGPAIPPFVELDRLQPGQPYDAKQVLANREGRLAAVITGTVADPVLTAPSGGLARWQGTISQIAALAARGETLTYPQVETIAVATSGATQNRERVRTAQSGQVLLFLLIMLLASMVLSNLVEEKGNKIIEILAAAIPMDAVFMGKLFAMLGVSVVGITVWGSIGTSLMLLAGGSLSDLANPGVGWPLFFLLGVTYFALGYLLLGSIFLAVGSMAATVREVQTLAMPVTMAQVMVFFLSSLAVTEAGTWVEYAAMVFPLSSPFAMLARAAMEESLWPHLLAIAWQIVCVALFIRIGAGLFRKRVMKSGPQGSNRKRRLFGRAAGSV